MVWFCSFNANANLKRLTLGEDKDQQKNTPYIVHHIDSTPLREIFFNEYKTNRRTNYSALGAARHRRYKHIFLKVHICKNNPRIDTFINIYCKKKIQILKINSMFKRTTESSSVTKHVMKEKTEFKKSDTVYQRCKCFCELHFQRCSLLRTVHEECGRFPHKYDKSQNQ